MTYELKPHNPDHPYARRFVGCGHGVLFTDYCKDCEIVSLQSTYKSAIRRVQACRDGLRRLGVFDSEEDAAAVAAPHFAGIAA